MLEPSRNKSSKIKSEWSGSEWYLWEAVSLVQRIVTVQRWQVKLLPRKIDVKNTYSSLRLPRKIHVKNIYLSLRQENCDRKLNSPFFYHLNNSPWYGKKKNISLWKFFPSPILPVGQNCTQILYPTAGLNDQFFLKDQRPQLSFHSLFEL